MKYSLNPQVTRNLAKRHEGEPATEMQCAVTQILQYSGLEKSMDCIVHGVTKSQTQLRNFDFLIQAVPFVPPGAFIPRCNEEGYYKATQCHGSTGQCWCVDKYGNELAGSRKQGAVNCGE